MKREFWVKMEFADFCSHYLNMTQKEVFMDVKQSMADMMSGNSAGKSFGAKMVAKARERLAKLGPINSENGKKGADAKWNRIPLPKNKQEVIGFAADNGLDTDDASTWAEQNLKERRGMDKDGNPINNWKGALTNYCKAMKTRRSA
jgi:hypothetical protein